MREIELLSEAQVTLICDRAKFPPYGLAGGAAGASGSAALIDAEGHLQVLPSKCSLHAQKGARIRLETPGGGGWGDPALAAIRSGREQSAQ